MTGKETKLKDCYVVTIYTNHNSQYEQDVFLMGDLQIGISTKEDVINVFGYPKGISEENTIEDIKALLAFNYDWGYNASHIHQGSNFSLDFFHG